MSADNWAQCPRCSDGVAREIIEMERKIQECYGKVEASLFLEMTNELVEQRARYEKSGEDYNSRSFREDYEIYGAETGTVTVGYHGQCTKCGLKLSFQEEHPFYPEAPNAG